MFPQKLNQIRKSKGYTAQYMANLLSVSLRTYRNYESGHSSPSLEALVKIADILEVSTDVLLCRDKFIASMDQQVHAISSDEYP